MFCVQYHDKWRNINILRHFKVKDLFKVCVDIWRWCANGLMLHSVLSQNIKRSVPVFRSNMDISRKFSYYLLSWEAMTRTCLNNRKTTMWFHCCGSYTSIWDSSWDYGTYHIGDQRRLRRALASVQSRQSLCCSRSQTWSMEVDGRVRPKIRRLAQLDGCTCTF